MNIHFAKKFKPLEEIVFTEGTTFSASKMLEELRSLIPEAESMGSDSQELCHLLKTITSVCHKTEGSYDEELIDSATWALDIQEDRSILSPLENVLMMNQVAHAFDRLEEYSNAAEWGRKAVEAAQGVKGLDQGQILNLRQSLGYYLHSAKKFEEAYQVNLKLLADAEKALGPQHEELMYILINLAQNAHSLSKLHEAQDFAIRARDLAKQHRNTYWQFELLFQLAVLAYEMGNADESENFFQERIRLAQRMNDPDLLDKAQADLSELKKRLAQSQKS